MKSFEKEGEEHWMQIYKNVAQELTNPRATPGHEGDALNALGDKIDDFLSRVGRRLSRKREKRKLEIGMFLGTSYETKEKYPDPAELARAIIGGDVGYLPDEIDKKIIPLFPSISAP